VSALSHLTHLSYLISIGDSGPDFKDHIINLVAGASTTLRYIRLAAVGCPGPWIGLIPQEMAADSCVAWYECQSGEVVSQKEWGDFFLGAQPTSAIQLDN
jgi:hypothetical protein